MDLRAAEVQDAARIREISEQSFQTSYSLSPDQIETIIRGVFSDDHLATRIGSDETLLLLSEADGETTGFVDVALGTEALVRWLHVDPGSRGRGAGTQLFEHAQSEATDRDLPLVARVLTENEEGKEFPERFGLRRTGRAKLEFGSEVFFEEVYTEEEGLAALAGEPAVDVPETTTVDGRQLAVDEDDVTPGTEGPFFALYEGTEHKDRYGYFCSNCGSTDVGSDTLGRLECQNCGNKHLADQWDAAYL